MNIFNDIFTTDHYYGAYRRVTTNNSFLIETLKLRTEKEEDGLEKSIFLLPLWADDNNTMLIEIYSQGRS